MRVSNSLDPDQDRRAVGPDLGTKCLQRLSADDKESPLARKELRAMLNLVNGIIVRKKSEKDAYLRRYRHFVKKRF